MGGGGIVVPPRFADELPPEVDGGGLVGRLPLVGGGGLVPAGEKDAPAEDRDGDLAEGDTDGATDPGTDAVGSDDEASGGAVTDSAADDASADDETTDSADKVAVDGAEVGTIRHELLDRTLIINQQHATAVLRHNERHYNNHRPHRTLGQAAPQRPLPHDTRTEIHNVRPELYRFSDHL
jgi:hypothetical protein